MPQDNSDREGWRIIPFLPPEFSLFLDTAPEAAAVFGRFPGAFYALHPAEIAAAAIEARRDLERLERFPDGLSNRLAPANSDLLVASLENSPLLLQSPLGSPPRFVPQYPVFHTLRS